ncbi:MAG: SPFH domain-containing protein [Clostridiales bacterium]|nr:SPFH domain-containing protein [Clostridiales bacterium]
MGLIKAFSGALTGTFADQWREIVTAGPFDEQTAVTPGLIQVSNNGKGSNINHSAGVITNNSKIFVPENTAAFIFSQAGIEAVITQPGGYVYQNGQESVFDGNGILSPLAGQIKDRFKYGGQPSVQTLIAFINLREIRNLKFGTRGPVMYNDMFYGTDLEIQAYGTYSLKIVDPVKFVRNFVPANTLSYSFGSKEARTQLMSEFLQSFLVAINKLSGTYRISQLPSQANDLAEAISTDPNNAGSWEERFGFKIVRVGIQDIEFAPESKELVKQYSSNKMNLKAYDDISQKASNIGAQQKIAQGIQDNGLGDGGAGLVFGMNMAQGLTPQAGTAPAMSFDQQIETVKKLKTLLDEGILSQEEFDAKKKEIMGL